MGVSSQQRFDVWPYNRDDVEWQETEEDGLWVPKAEPLPKCTCGSAAVKGPGHSDWCDVAVNHDKTKELQ